MAAANARDELDRGKMAPRYADACNSSPMTCRGTPLPRERSVTAKHVPGRIRHDERSCDTTLPAETKGREIAPEQLRWLCDSGQLPFETTKQIERPDGTIGQDRAVRALTFGLEIEASGSIYL